MSAVEELEYLIKVKFNRKEYLGDLRNQWEQVRSGDKYFREQIEQINSAVQGYFWKESLNSPHFSIFGFYEWYKYGPKLVYEGINAVGDLLKLEKYIHFLAKVLCDHNEKDSFKNIFETAVSVSTTLTDRAGTELTKEKLIEIKESYGT